MADIAHRETDALIAATERKIRVIYNEAVQDMQNKLDIYFKEFAEKDKYWQSLLSAGKITEKEYTDWKTGQIMIGKRWEEMKQTLAEDLHNSNAIARSIVNGYMPDAYALNHNYATFLVEKGSQMDTSYTLYDRQTVERLMRDDPQLLPPPGKNITDRVAAGKDILWQEGQIQSVTLQSILQGESIGDMAERIARTMGEYDRRDSVRYARTAMTGAQNAGRHDGYERAKRMGIPMKQTWIATLDNRTRDAHRELDGQTVEVEEPFEVDGYEIRYPGDPDAPGYLIWNCRCTTIAQIKGFERDASNMDLRHDERLGTMSYEEWKEGHRAKARGGVSTDGLFKNVRGVTEDFQRGMESVLQNASVEAAKQLYAKYADELVCVDPNTKKGAYFSSADGGVTMNIGKVAAGNSYETPYETAFHEFGHQIDFLANNSNRWQYLSNTALDGKRLETVIKEDFQAFKKSIGASRAVGVVEFLRNENMDKRTCGNISDILEKCTGQSYPLGIGHGASYHKREGATEREFFAEVLDSSIANPASYAQMVRLFPNAVDMVWKLIGGIL